MAAGGVDLRAVAVVTVLIAVAMIGVAKAVAVAIVIARVAVEAVTASEMIGAARRFACFKIWAPSRRR